MIVDFQHHFTPRELVEAQTGGGGLGTAFKDGAPAYTFHSLLYDLDAHIQMMDTAGIDIAVLTSGQGYDADLETCQLINRRMKEAGDNYGGRFIGLGHVPPLGGVDAMLEIARCAEEYGFPGVAIASEVQGLALDDTAFDPFWQEAARRGLYVFIHPMNHSIAWNRMNSDDLHRGLGRELSLMVAAIRMTCSGVFDRHPGLQVQFAHLAGGLGWYLPRLRTHLEDKEFWGIQDSAEHGRRPAHDITWYMENHMMFDTAGWSGPTDTARRAVQWIKHGLMDIPAERLVFATDYPQAVRDDNAIRDYVAAVRALGADGEAILSGNVARLIPRLADA